MKDYGIAIFCADNMEAEGEAIKKYEEMLDSIRCRKAHLKDIIKCHENPETTEDGEMLEFVHSQEDYERAKDLLPKLEELETDIREIVSDEKNHMEKLLKNCRVFDKIETAQD